MTDARPVLPALLAAPLRRLPRALPAALAPRVLERLFAGPLAAGEFDFLDGRTLALEVLDAGIALGLTVRGRRFVARPSAPADASIAGNVHDFLLLAARTEDPDTLFFQRRLRLGGDVELGLHVKNLLDALGEQAIPERARALLAQATRVYERLFAGRAPGRPAIGPAP